MVSCFKEPELHWPIRMNHQKSELSVVDWEASWCWFSVMLVKTFVIDFTCRDNFKAAIATYHNDVGYTNLVYGSSSKRATCSFLWGTMHLTRDLQTWPFKPWRGQVTQRTWQENSFSIFPRFCTAHSDGRPMVYIVLWSKEITENFELIQLQPSY